MIWFSTKNIASLESNRIVQTATVESKTSTYKAFDNSLRRSKKKKVQN